MKINKLINKLQRLQEEHGNVEVELSLYSGYNKREYGVTSRNIVVANKKTNPIVQIRYTSSSGLFRYY